MRPHGRATVSVRNPQAFAVCDRCGFLYNHHQLQWQSQWQGPKLQNLRLLVCPSCLDIPQEQLRTIIIPPDPIPIQNPRPEAYTEETNPISGLGFDIGTMNQYAGLSAAFDGSENKERMFCAGLLVSDLTDNWVGKQWITIPQPVSAETETQSVIATRVILVAPSDSQFLELGAPTYQVQGSDDYLTWTTLSSGTVPGEMGERIDITSLPGTSYHFHRVIMAGDGANPIAIAQFVIYGIFVQGSATVPSIQFLVTEDGRNIETEGGDIIII